MLSLYVASAQRCKWEFKATFSYISEFKFKLGYGKPVSKRDGEVV